jgi:RNA polymerase sigma-70 factor (ECF subfamily)
MTMPPDDLFPELLRRVRGGDQQAAAELVRHYEASVRRVARIQMRDPRLRRCLDSMDICQSVFSSFFQRVYLGQYELKTPEDLCKLLATMARNKVIAQVRRPHVNRRQECQPRGEEETGTEPAAPDASPARQAEARDLLDAVRGRLTEEECWLAEQRAQGRPWAEVAAELNGSPEALRKKHDRALQRVAQELGLDDWSPE